MIGLGFNDFIRNFNPRADHIHIDPEPKDTLSAADPVESLEQQEYSRIIGDKELFLGLFLKTMHTSIKDKNLTIVNKDNTTTISATKKTITQITSTIEVVRELFEKSLTERRDLTMVGILMLYDLFIREKSKTPLDLKNWTMDQPDKIFIGTFDMYIRPVLTPITKLLGGTCVEGETTQQIQTEHNTNRTEKAVAWSIQWDKEEHFVYPIPPVKLLTQPDMRQALYEMYKTDGQPCCDWSLISKEGSSVKINGNVLSIYGGEAFKTAMSSALKESSEKAIKFPDVSLELMQQFVEYLYLGPAALVPENLRGKNIDIYTLLELAHCWQIPGLVDCCTNFISVACTPQEYQTVWNLAGVYSNVHLAELCVHWLKQTQDKSTARAAAPSGDPQYESIPPLEKADDLYGMQDVD